MFGRDPYDDGGFQYAHSMEKDVEELRKLLTLVCRSSDGSGLKLPEPVERWWRSYKQWLEKREAEEQAIKQKESLRANALKKLSPEEKKALGL